jgi:TPR repeat protein
MTTKMSEHLIDEWRNDPAADILYNTVSLLKFDASNALEKLKFLAESGSSLSMVYLGTIYLGGLYNVPKNVPLGEYWLSHAVESGSIEGAHVLATHFFYYSNDNIKAKHLLENLKAKNFSPAMYLLGQGYYSGWWGEKNVSEAVKSWNMASKFNKHFFRDNGFII